MFKIARNAVPAAKSFVEKIGTQVRSHHSDIPSTNTNNAISGVLMSAVGIYVLYKHSDKLGITNKETNHVENLKKTKDQDIGIS